MECELRKYKFNTDIFMCYSLIGQSVEFDIITYIFF